MSGFPCEYPYKPLSVKYDAYRTHPQPQYRQEVNGAHEERYDYDHTQPQSSFAAACSETPPKPFYCFICKFDCGNELAFRNHGLSLVHKQNVEKKGPQQFTSDMLIQERDPTPKHLLTPEFYCKTCDITTTSQMLFVVHQNSDRHKQFCFITERESAEESARYSYSFYILLEHHVPFKGIPSQPYRAPPEASYERPMGQKYAQDEHYSSYSRDEPTISFQNSDSHFSAHHFPSRGQVCREPIQDEPRFTHEDTYVEQRANRTQPPEWRERKSDPKFFCKNCDLQLVNLTSWKLHMNGARHAKKLRKIEELRKAALVTQKVELPLDPKSNKSAMQIIFDKHEEPIIGLKYVTEYRRKRPNGAFEFDYWCSLCQSNCGSGNIVFHVTGSRHRLAYMKERHMHYFTLVLHSGDKKSDRTPLIKEYSMLIENDEGRGVMTVSGGPEVNGAGVKRSSADEDTSEIGRSKRMKTDVDKEQEITEEKSTDLLPTNHSKYKEPLAIDTKLVSKYLRNFQIWTEEEATFAVEATKILSQKLLAYNQTKAKNKT
ncbi:hypothetical protein CAPTEDRAFT_201832 [Capitella teleta]|uniref:C2H2-type domain-containing protein n=1 Tax=Capitella teleta TaxID=283909 RepID=R7UA80_CAPTE|nr:hypothetical protein CAPTEDRAFT_201832 [Capitella teleta]|eukprot:ELU03011.1 hypothetical protein CAPTEDRAFT_201832 [Capitella teleta]